MDIREATQDDADAIRAVAPRSLAASYDFLGEDDIETAVGEWYGEDALAEKLDDEGLCYLVAVEDGDVVGFSESAVLPAEPEATILWLHVHPDHRGRGVGAALLDATREALEARDAERVMGLVLEANEAGTRFYEAHGFEQAGQRSADIAGESYPENLYVDAGEIEVEEVEYEGERFYLNHAEAERGSEAPFFAAYRDADVENRYGWYCANDETLNTAMDSMERIVCNECGNRRKAARWDAAYL